MAISGPGLRLHRSLFLASPRAAGAIVPEHRFMAAFCIYTGLNSDRTSGSGKAGCNRAPCLGGTLWDADSRGHQHNRSGEVPGLPGAAGNCCRGRDSPLPFSWIAAPERAWEANSDGKAPWTCRCDAVGHGPAQAAEDGGSLELARASRDVYSRFNAILYLASARYIGITQREVAGKEGPRDPPGRGAGVLPVHPARGRSSWRICGRDYHGRPAGVASRKAESSSDAALTALDSAGSARFLNEDDPVTSYRGLTH